METNMKDWKIIDLKRMIKTRFHPLTMFSTVQQMAVLRNQHLKIYTDLKMKRSTVANNKVCPVCSKVFFRKQITTGKSTLSTAKIWQAILHLMSLIINMTNRSRTKPCRQWLLIETVYSEVPQSLHRSFHQSPRRGRCPIWPKWSRWIIEHRFQVKARLERTLPKLKLQLDYSMNVTESALKKLKKDLKKNQIEAVKFVCDCFDDMLDYYGFIAWLTNGVGYKPCQLKQILKDKPNKRNNKFTSTDFEEIYVFWLDSSINSNESAYNIKRINKRSFLEQFSNIKVLNVVKKRLQLKNGSKVVVSAPRMAYTESVRKLHSGFCQKFTQVPLTVFFKYKLLRQTSRKRKAKLLVHQLSQPTPPPID